MKRERRKFTSAFKAKVALEAIKEKETIQQLAAKFELHPNQITQWKREFLDGAESVFSGVKEVSTEEDEAAKDKLYGKIGKLQMEIEFLKKVLGK